MTRGLDPLLIDTAYDLLSPHRSLAKAIDKERQEALDATFSHHRLEPLAAWRLRDGDQPPVSDTLLRRWNDVAHDWTIEALGRQADLVHTVGVLGREGIATVALKGAYLAFHAYPEPGLRPLRDLDLLFESETAILAADEALRRAGFTPYAPLAPGQRKAALKTSHQLPPLYAPDCNSLIELHLRAGHDAPSGLESAILQGARTHRLLDVEVRYPDPATLMVHLLRHAAIDHRLNTGPLVISDIAMLSRDAQFDPDRFAHELARDDLAAAAAPLLAIAAMDWPGHGVPRPSGGESCEQLVPTYRRMMLYPPGAVTAVRRGAARRSRKGALSLLRPSEESLASAHGDARGALARAQRYAAHLWRLATQRAPALWRQRLPGEDQAKLTEDFGELEAHLEGPEHNSPDD